MSILATFLVIVCLSRRDIPAILKYAVVAVYAAAWLVFFLATDPTALFVTILSILTLYTTLHLVYSVYSRGE